jgi:hypothetical protein
MSSPSPTTPRSALLIAAGAILGFAGAFLLLGLATGTMHGPPDPRSSAGIQHTLFSALWSLIAGAVSQLFPEPMAGATLRVMMVLLGGLAILILVVSWNFRDYMILLTGLVMTPCLFLGAHPLRKWRKAASTS